MTGATESRQGQQTADVVLRIRGMTKRFGGTTALDAVDVDVLAGEVHALVGHNGSGKSTLIKTLAGYHHADAGAVEVDGETVGAAHHGEEHDRLRFVHQDLGLVLELSAMENLALRGGFARARLGNIDWRRQRRATMQLLERFAVELDVDRPLAEATPVERTVVAIVGALQGWEGGRGVLVLDEPTAVLPPSEVRHLFTLVEQIQASGTSVLYVSHRLDEIFEIADRVTVLRAGRVVATRPVAGLAKRELVTLLLGSAPVQADPPDAATDEVVLQAAGLEGRYLRDAALTLRRGEVLGLAGAKGSGADELPYVLAGAVPERGAGWLRLADEEEWSDVATAGERGLALVPADRGREAVIPDFSVRDNLTLSVLDRLGSAGGLRLDHGAEARMTDEWLHRLEVIGPGAEAPIGALSGGNQQKVVMGRCLLREPRVLLLCEPTAGVDVGTRRALYDLVAARVEQGLSVIVSSSDVGDLVALCRRVVVFANGVAVREIAGDEVTEAALVHAMEEEMTT